MPEFKYTSAPIEGNDAFYISITNEAIKQTIKFKPFIETLADNFLVTKTPTQVYGRMDDIQSYQKTSRNFSLSFSVPAGSDEEAKDNLQRIQTLIRFQYPIYNSTEEDTISGILAPPLCSIVFANFTKFNSNTGKLYGYFSNVNYAPDFSQGTSLTIDKKGIYPQLYKLSLSMDVIHVDYLGWKKTSKGYKWRSDNSNDNTSKGENNSDQSNDAKINKVCAEGFTTP